MEQQSHDMPFPHIAFGGPVFGGRGVALDHSLRRWKHTMSRRQHAEVHGDVSICSAHSFRWAFLGRGNSGPLLASLGARQEQSPKEQTCMTRCELFPHAAFGRPVFKGAALVHSLPRCDLARGRHRRCENALRDVNQIHTQLSFDPLWGRQLWTTPCLVGGTL